MQNIKLDNIVDYALKNNKFFRDKYVATENTNFDKLDILEKAELQVNMLVSDEYQRFPGYTQLVKYHTTGTTGRCLKVFWDRTDYLKSMMPAVYFRKKYYNISPQDHYITFFSTLYVNNKIQEAEEYVKNYNSIAINKQIVPVLNEQRYIDEICAFTPTWMIIQPSLLLMLDELNLDWMYNLKYIETTGEHLLESQRIYFQEKYDVTIANNYGAVETNYIALECPYGNKHIVEDNVFVELDNVDNNTGVGEIIVSSLHNRAMPIIRYRLGDYIRISDTTCKCGCKSKIIDVVEGRTVDHLINKSGQKTSWYPLFNAVENVNEQLGHPIKEVKISQESDTLIVLYIELFEKFKAWEDSVRKRLLQYICKIKHMEDYLFEIKYGINSRDINSNQKKKVFTRNMK